MTMTSADEREAADLPPATVARYEQRLGMERACQAIRELGAALQASYDEEIARLRRARVARAAEKKRDDAAYAAWKKTREGVPR